MDKFVSPQRGDWSTRRTTTSDRNQINAANRGEEKTMAIHKVFVFEEYGMPIPGILKLSRSAVERSAHLVIGATRTDNPGLLKLESGDPVIVSATEPGKIFPMIAYDLGIGLFGEGISKGEVTDDLLAHLRMTREEIEALPTRRGAWV